MSVWLHSKDILELCRLVKAITPTVKGAPATLVLQATVDRMQELACEIASQLESEV